MRTVMTSSGATAVQVVWSWRKGSRSIEHIGSAHDDGDSATHIATRHRYRDFPGVWEIALDGSEFIQRTLPCRSQRRRQRFGLLIESHAVSKFESPQAGIENGDRDRVAHCDVSNLLRCLVEYSLEGNGWCECNGRVEHLSFSARLASADFCVDRRRAHEWILRAPIIKRNGGAPSRAPPFSRATSIAC